MSSEKKPLVEMQSLAVNNYSSLLEEGDNIKSDEVQSPNNPARKLTMVDGIAIIIGIIIGSGIFSSPGLVLERCGSPALVLIAWIISGCLVILLAQCYLELGAMMPSAGGDFDYIQRAFGDRAAFSFAWYNFFVGKTGAIAIIATIFGRYFEAVLSGNANMLLQTSDTIAETSTSKIAAVSLVVFITLLNCAGVKESAVLSIILTSTKIALVLMVFVFSVVYMSAGGQYAVTATQNLSPTTSFENSNDIVHFGSALVACLWCFDGFADANFLLEELIHPIRDLPIIVKYSLVIVTTCYLCINVGYLSVLRPDVIMGSTAIAVDFGSTVSNIFPVQHRNILGLVLALGVSLSAAGAMNGSVMTGGRAFYAVARAGKMPRILAQLNVAGSPWAALVCQGVWAILLLMIPGSNFGTLLDYFGPTSWCFYALTAASLIVLRYKEPDAERPYKIPLYPLPPVAVITIALVIVVSGLMVSPGFILLALGFTVLAFPVHMVMEWYQHKQLQQQLLHQMSSHFSLSNVESFVHHSLSTIEESDDIVEK